MPPEHLGAWLRDFDELLGAHDLEGVPYGHFGDGCVHVRIDFPFVGESEEAGKRIFREFLTSCAIKLREYGGSLSGEHGDGRARSELLPLMYDEESLRLFAAAKAICDPTNLLNPGVLVDPDPFDAQLRPTRPRLPIVPALRMTHDGGSLRQRRAPLHRRRQVRRPGHHRRDVPVVPRDEGREGLHPRPLARPPGGARRRAGPRARRPGRRGGARPVPVLQGLRVRLPDRCRHGDLQVRGAAPEVRRQASPAQPLHARSAAALGGAGGPDGAACSTGCSRSAPVARMARATAGIDQRRSIPDFATTTLRRGSVGAATARASPTSGSGPTPSPTTSTRRTPTPRSGCSRRPGCGSG